ncbi:hypothetical protein [Pseudoxanthomonas winnipegensis]|uniref:Secreted protein n=1 Tax=Pseudoxanthomonas winnipegensis TaxID=2480810 RepID=A0A4Q8M8N2_9GAMM|nr:hypothetical protein [Pseudoxanthomonas winnipegensis]TAA45697.1 hypothetical protein EA655_05830 [Pseudoxanthomonas winnipegensis]
MSTTAILLRRRSQQALRACVCLGLLAACAPAFAQWHVTDETTQTKIDSMKQDVNERLEKIYKQSNVDGKSFNTTEKPSFSLQNGKAGQQSGDGDSKLQKRSGDTVMNKRCRNETANPLNTQQLPICQDIVKHEDKLFNYLLDMLDLVKDRQEQLKAITEERANIKPGDENEYGQLQSNTNRLLALQAQQQIDAMNLRLTLDSYDRYLNGRRAELADITREAQRGPAGLSLTSVLSSAASIGILKTALETSKKYSN